MGLETEKDDRAVQLFLHRFEKRELNEDSSSFLRVTDSAVSQLSNLWKQEKSAPSSADSSSATTEILEDITKTSRLGRYHIVKTLGQGGFGTVFLAREDGGFGRTVAIKVLHRPQQGAKLSFFRESVLSAELKHPGVVSSFEFGEHAGIPFYVMEYVEGNSLDKIITDIRSQYLANPLRKEHYGEFLLRTAICTAEALSFLHRNGVVHCDFKPGNILIDRKGDARLTDLGLARLCGSEERARLGTLPYTAPEQLKGEEPDLQSDLFSFGATFYEAFSLRRAFGGANSKEIIASVLDREPLPLRQLNSQIPGSIEKIIRKCLQKNKSQRYQNADELLKDLRRVNFQRAMTSSSKLLLGALTGAAALALMISLFGGFSSEVPTQVVSKNDLREPVLKKPVEQENSPAEFAARVIPVDRQKSFNRSKSLVQVKPVERPAESITRLEAPKPIEPAIKVAVASEFPNSDLRLDYQVETKSAQSYSLGAEKTKAEIRVEDFLLWTGSSVKGLACIGVAAKRSPSDWVQLHSDFLKERRNQNNLGQKLIVDSNSWGSSDNEVANRRLQQAVDGVCFSGIFLLQFPQVDWEKTTHRNIQLCRAWLSQKKLVLLMPKAMSGVDSTSEMRRYLAAMSMMIRKPGDSIFVAGASEESTADWVSWPAKLGAPRGEYVIEPKSYTIHRAFQNGTLFVDLQAKIANVFTGEIAIYVK